MKDFGEATFRQLGTKSFHELMNYSYSDLICLGPGNADKLLERINDLRTTPIYDYKLVGAIGFTGIAVETWKKILNVIPLTDIITNTDEELFAKLISIKGIGDATAAIIVDERIYLADDINLIATMPNVIPSFGVKSGKSIRFTGCRPNENLLNYLNSRGCDANGNAGVTKTTDILVVPYEGFISVKTSKAGPNTIIIDMPQFAANPDMFIS